MEYKLIHCDTVIKKITNKDSLFQGNFCIDPYQNCEFGCQYCDSSLEKTIYVKANIIDILKKELQSIKNGRIIIGSVNDPYQKAEEKYELTKNILETLTHYKLPCHILTKSPLIIRDKELLSQLNCMVTISISSLNDQVVRIFEPRVPSPSSRLQAVQRLRSHGIHVGIALMPIFPYIVESEIESIVKVAKGADAQYLLHKYLELKGDQERVFRALIETHYPHLLAKYNMLYENDYKPRKKYIQALNKTLTKYCRMYDIPNKISIYS